MFSISFFELSIPFNDYFSLFLLIVSAGIFLKNLMGYFFCISDLYFLLSNFHLNIDSNFFYFIITLLIYSAEPENFRRIVCHQDLEAYRGPRARARAPSSSGAGSERKKFLLPFPEESGNPSVFIVSNILSNTCLFL